MKSFVPIKKPIAIPFFAYFAFFAVNQPMNAGSGLLFVPLDNLKAAAHILVFEANQLTS